MQTLPNGVTIRDFYSPREVREDIFRRVQEEFTKKFPMENDSVRIELDSIGYDEKKKKHSLEDYQNAVLTGGRLAAPLRARVRLVDKKFNVPLEEKDVVLANVPYMTDDGTFVVGGNHYITNNQARLKSGVYARAKDNGELESHINVKSGTGPSMRIFMEPENGVFRASIDKSNIKLYPILNALGIPDEKLREVWGDEILKKNQEAWDRGAFSKFYGKLLKNRAVADASDDDKKVQILDRLSKAELDPEVTTRTLGRPYGNLSLDTIVDASHKLLKVNRGEEEEDDRDHPANRTYHSVDDFMAERVSKDAGMLAKTLLYKATYDRSLKQLRPGYFTPQLEGLVVGNQLTQLVAGLNPMELYDQHKRVVQLGEGGVGSMESIPMSSRNLHAGELGMVDPIRSSESRSIGVDQRFTMSAMKGSDNHVYYPLKNKRTGQIEYLNAVQLTGKSVAFPQAHNLQRFFTPQPTPVTPPVVAPPTSMAPPVVEPIEPPTPAAPGIIKAADLLDLICPRQQKAADLLSTPGMPAPTAPPPAAPAMAPSVTPAMPGMSAPPKRMFLSAVKNGKIDQFPDDDVDYELVSPNHQFTETSVMVPLTSTIKGARTFIASKYATQALPLVNPDSPLVDVLDDDTDDGYTKTLGRRLGLKNSDFDGVVKNVSEKHIDLTDIDGKTQRIELKRYFPNNRKTYTSETPMVTAGDRITKGQPIARNNYVDNGGRLAIGKNLSVAFMPAPGGATFEDAIVVSESAAKKMTSPHLYGFDVEHKHGVESGKDKFISLFPNKYTNEQLAKLDANGMVKPGVKIDPGDPVLLSYSPRSLSSKDAALGNLSKVLKNSYRDLSQTWDKSSPGVVAHAVSHRSGLGVRIATNMPLQEGDKISARSGAKGVVSKIVPDDQMVRSKDSGPVDVIINPAALIGRVNPGMVFEALLGKVAAKHGKTYNLPSFSQESYRDYVENELKAHGESDGEDLEDPETGKSIPQVLTGRQFFMKLEHTSESKLSGRGEGGSDINEQPTKGGKEGAKRLGGLQNYALLSHRADHVLEDAHVYRGSSSPEMWRRWRLGESLPPPKAPFIYDKFLNSLKAAGVNPRPDEKGRLKLLAMTDRDVDELARYEVQVPETISHKDGSPIKGGLMDFSLHGGPDGKGWSYIKLEEPMPSPVMEEPIRRLLGITEKQMRGIIAGTETINGRRGPQALYDALKGVKLDELINSDRETIRLGKKTKRDEAVRRVNFATGLKKSGIEPHEMMITKVPVIPPAYRPVVVMGDMHLTSDANYLYKDLMSSRDVFRSNKAELSDEDLGDERLAIYDSIRAIQGMGDPINVETANKGVKGFIRQVAGVGGPKTGMFVSKVIGHPVNTVGRSVIVPNADLDMDQVGIPEKMAWEMFEPHVMRSMVREGMPATEAAKRVEKHDDFAKRHLLKEMERRKVMYSRDPALHRFSIMGANAVLVPGNNIHLSPLVVKPFGADFDGDQMNVHVPITDKAIKDVEERMMPSKNLFNLRGNKVQYLPSQEFILGLFGATQPKKGAQPVVFKTTAEAIAAYKSGAISIDQPVSIQD